MIVHIVLWRLKNDADKPANLQRMKSLLEGLQGTVPGVERLEVGLNFEPSDAAVDISLYSTFPSREALAAYQAHPEHQKIVAFIRSVAVERRVADYEI